MSKHSDRSGSVLDRRSVRRLYRLGGVCAAALLTVWWYTTHTNPSVTIPNPVLPTPTAFDFYVRAANALTDKREIGDAVSRYPRVRLTTAQKAEIVRQNARAIDTLHAGLAYPYLNPPVRSLYDDTAYYSKFRSVAHLLLLQGQTRAEKGDWAGAGESYLDIIEMGEEIPHGSPIIGAVDGISLQYMGRRPMEKVVEHLNVTQSHAAIQRLSGLMERHVPIADSLQEEKWVGQAVRMEIFKGVIKPAPGEKAEEGRGPRGPSGLDLLYFFQSKKRIMNSFTVYMDQSIQQARQPYSLHLPPPREPREFLNKLLLPIFLHEELKDASCQTQNGFLVVTLALHAYRLQHHHYPASLMELTPEYLKKLPEDPFIARDTFKYRVEGEGYVLYSVGPDGKDDGGRMIDDPKHPESPDSTSPNARYFVGQNSVGDIVAGKNLW